MISALVRSAFQTGYLSVESEGLIHQVITAKAFTSLDVEALQKLHEAVETGHIRREARHAFFPIPAVTR